MFLKRASWFKGLSLQLFAVQFFWGVLMWRKPAKLALAAANKCVISSRVCFVAGRIRLVWPLQMQDEFLPFGVSTFLLHLWAPSGCWRLGGETPTCHRWVPVADGESALVSQWVNTSLWANKQSQNKTRVTGSRSCGSDCICHRDVVSLKTGSLLVWVPTGARRSKVLHWPGNRL